MTIKQRIKKLEQQTDPIGALPVWRDDFTDEQLSEWLNNFI